LRSVTIAVEFIFYSLTCPFQLVVLKRAEKEGRKVKGGGLELCVKSAFLSYLKYGKPASI
jgi:hypothetical protein